MADAKVNKTIEIPDAEKDKFKNWKRDSVTESAIITDIVERLAQRRREAENRMFNRAAELAGFSSLDEAQRNGYNISVGFEEITIEEK